MSTTTPSLSRLKQRAKLIKKEKNISHSGALDLIAKELGFENWKVCQQEWKEQSPIKLQPPIKLIADKTIKLKNNNFGELDTEQIKYSSLEIKRKINSNKKTLINIGVEFSTFEPTVTGLKKFILDATQSVRTHFEIECFHFYGKQEQGSEAKVMKSAFFLLDDKKITSKVSLYRPKTKKGDPRMWFRNLSKLAEAQDILAVTIYGDSAYLFNLSKADLNLSLEKESSLIGIYLRQFNKNKSSIAQELLEKLKQLAKEPLKSLRFGDTGVGYTLETHLGIEANSSKKPDYKGIEIKAGRGSKSRSSLFAQVPDWSISPCQRSAEILNKYGYERDDEFKLYCTVSTQKENSQGLSFIYNSDKDELQEWHNGQELVAVWPGKSLRERLKEKHNETFWVHAESFFIDGHEFFQLQSITYTQKPILSQLMPLIQAGIITMDHLIKRDNKGRVSEKGPLFKLNRLDLNLLFPKPQFFSLKD